ncbi:hypothetical protein COV15_00250 [Candidatus Woesearchaeota archaeon CG10_big_fil_rev_8_21_14_0_10_34_12]|nr:MAG: hypothetical protein COV15_00250 [Candidatus Woesearchaeota archaeon CG10_big_fil_rev_8_21_14_0_10_34_12]
MDEVKLQIGKKGLNKESLTAIENLFKTHANMRISVLKSASGERKEIEEIAEKIKHHLGKNYTFRIIGFTIILKKWKKPQKQ